MKRVFFIVGPTATGKSEIAADVAHEVDAEIVSADAFQIYRGLDLLTAKPDSATLVKARHHLIGTMSILEEMNAAKFRGSALRAIGEIHSRGKSAIVVGGSGLYIKALTDGFLSAPASDLKLRTQLNELSLDQLRAGLIDIDPEMARKIDMKNRRRLVRALEICLLTGKPVSAVRSHVVAAVADRGPRSASAATARGVFVFRNRDELYERINRRVKAMFENGVIEQVRTIGAMSETASKMIGLREIRELLDEKISPDPPRRAASSAQALRLAEELQTEGACRGEPIDPIGCPWARGGSILLCVAQIQQATRRYAKRQLTWFRHQTNFEALNLSLLTHKEAVKWISQRALRSFARRND